MGRFYRNIPSSKKSDEGPRVSKDKSKSVIYFLENAQIFQRQSVSLQVVVYGTKQRTTLGMREWINFCQPRADFPRKNVKENMRNNRCHLILNACISLDSHLLLNTFDVFISLTSKMFHVREHCSSSCRLLSLLRDQECT